MGMSTSYITTSAYTRIKSAERDNDENMVIIDDPALA
jgi:hypothetical protein